MRCPNCGQEYDESVRFCGKCGTAFNNAAPSNNIYTYDNQANNQPVVNNNPQPIVYPNQTVYYQQPKKSNKGLIIGCIAFLFVLIVVGSFVKGVVLAPKDRTVLIYMAGSNLESEGAIATADLMSLDFNKTSANKTRVLVYAGGTKVWYNGFNAEENAIYELTSSGYTKLETYPLQSMGNVAAFKSFLDYAANKYKNSKYDLIIWDHGMGTLGSIADEKANDYLFVDEMKEVLETSVLTKKYKFDVVTFRTCLNATAEIANIFSDYANYMVASEEVTWGSSYSNVLSFLNSVEFNDDGITFSKKYLERYKKQMEEIFDYNIQDSTYSIIDLKKFGNVYDSINEFFKNINVDNEYNNIAKIRANLHQYGGDSNDFDTVDLFQLVTLLKSYDEGKANKLITNLNNAIITNWSINDASHGISIYFPFKALREVQAMHMNLYPKISFSPSYYSFIKTFYDIKNNNYSKKGINLPGSVMDFASSTIDKVDKELSMELNEEQGEDYSYANYLIFEKVEDNSFIPVYLGTDVKYENNKLTANMIDKLVYIKDNNSNEEFGLFVKENRNNNKFGYSSNALLINSDNEIKSIINIVEDNNGDLRIGNAIKEDDGKPSMVVLKLDNYDTIRFLNNKYSVYKEDGSFDYNFEDSNTESNYEIGTSNYELELKDLDSSKEYYFMFKIFDVANNYSYTPLVKIN